MILPPKNDVVCLRQISAHVQHLVDTQDAAIVALARSLGSIAAVIRYIRSRPQRDDVGAPHDGPKARACSPWQRLRLPAWDPNCVERAALYLALAELLDPGARRWLDTIRTEAGLLHTLPIEDGRAVVLDPLVGQNDAQAAVDVLGGVLPPTTPQASAAWIHQLASEPARIVAGGERAVRNARVGFQAVAQGEPLPRSLVDDVALALALAEREARRWGPAGLAVVDRVTRRLASPCADPSSPVAIRNAIDVAVRRYRLRPDVSRALRAVARTLADVAPVVAVPAAHAALAYLGVPPAMLLPVERALNREGLTLGPLVQPALPIAA
jgi:hypothetical protein